jgi:hypothetical protein
MQVGSVSKATLHFLFINYINIANYVVLEGNKCSICMQYILELNFESKVESARHRRMGYLDNLYLKLYCRR